MTNIIFFKILFYLLIININYDLLDKQIEHKYINHVKKKSCFDGLNTIYCRF